MFSSVLAGSHGFPERCDVALARSDLLRVHVMWQIYLDTHGFSEHVCSVVRFSWIPGTTCRDIALMAFWRDVTPSVTTNACAGWQTNAALSVIGYDFRAIASIFLCVGRFAWIRMDSRISPGSAEI